MLSDILDGFGLPFSTNLLFITKTIKPQCVRSSAYKWMWRQKYSDLLVIVKVFMVLRKEKRREDAETVCWKSGSWFLCLHSSCRLWYSKVISSLHCVSGCVLLNSITGMVVFNSLSDFQGYDHSRKIGTSKW